MLLIWDESNPRGLLRSGGCTLAKTLLTCNIMQTILTRVFIINIQNKKNQYIYMDVFLKSD